MSFADKLKAELCHLETKDVLEKKAEFLGFVKSRGALRLNQRKGYLAISVGSIASFKRLFMLSRSLGLDILETRVSVSNKLARKRGGELSYDYENIEEFLLSADISIRSDSIPGFVKDDPAYFGSFVRGLFLAGGSVVDPSKEYHLEIVLDTTEKFVNSLREHLWNSFNIKSGIVNVRNRFKLYIKSSGDIIELMSLMGAMEIVSFLSKTMEVRKIRGDVSRTINFLTANANKSGQAMARHVKAIQLVDKKVGLESLPMDLYQLAILRMENEELSLRELGELMKPPMSKSSVYNRLKKIVRMAEELGGFDEMSIL